MESSKIDLQIKEIFQKAQTLPADNGRAFANSVMARISAIPQKPSLLVSLIRFAFIFSIAIALYLFPLSLGGIGELLAQLNRLFAEFAMPGAFILMGSFLIFMRLSEGRNSFI